MLTKSLYLQGLACPRQFWCQYHAQELLLPTSKYRDAVLEQGQRIGKLAQQFFPGGQEIDPTLTLPQKIQTTQALLAEKKILFEGVFLHNDLQCRVDILQPHSTSETSWNLIEVKSSTKIKNEYLCDLAFQAYCLKKSGVDIKDCQVMYINYHYVKKSHEIGSDFFTLETVNDLLKDELSSVEDNIQRLLGILEGPMPYPRLGEECIDPKTCRVCLNELPKDNILELYRIQKSTYCNLLNDNIQRLGNIPPDMQLTEKQKIQLDCFNTGEPFINQTSIKEFIAKIEYPIYFLDFETIYPAIPIYIDTRPFQQVPFQLSIHCLQRRGSDIEHDIEHIECLSENPMDPRLDVIQALKAIGSTGSIVAYNAAFEKTRLREMARDFPAESEFLHGLCERMVDLLVPFREFWYYHPKQKGSASIKAVLPALVGKNYAPLAIHSGDMAAERYSELIRLQSEHQKNEHQDGLISETISTIRKQLLEYCKLDTEGMLDLFHVLNRIE